MQRSWDLHCRNDRDMTTPQTHPIWSIASLLTALQGFLASYKVDSARLDAELLIAHVLKVDRVYLYTHYDKPIEAHERTQLRALAKRRAAHEPMAYILKSREFYSRDFEVNAHVLIPRPETEHVIELVQKNFAQKQKTPKRILDVGTGSGVLAITLALLYPQAEVVACDLSEQALALAMKNARTHGCAERVRGYSGDLFAALPPAHATFDLIVSNPPYIDPKQRPHLSADVRDYEPSMALFSAQQGLEHLHRICTDAPGYMSSPAFLALEMGHDQNEAVSAYLTRPLWSEVQMQRDLQGLPRVMGAWYTAGDGLCAF